MKTIRRLFCVALAVSMLCASALAEIKLVPESTTMYLNSRNGNQGYCHQWDQLGFEDYRA